MSLAFISSNSVSETNERNIPNRKKDITSYKVYFVFSKKCFNMDRAFTSMDQER